MKETYKGYDIAYSDYDKEFVATIDDSSYSNRDLSVVRKYIDNLDKKDFERTAVLVEDGWGERLHFAPGMVTSVTKTKLSWEKVSMMEAWVVDTNKRRSKVNIKRLVLVNENNAKIIVELNLLQQKIKAQYQFMTTLTAQLERYQPTKGVKDETGEETAS